MAALDSRWQGNPQQTPVLAQRVTLLPAESARATPPTTSAYPVPLSRVQGVSVPQPVPFVVRPETFPRSLSNASSVKTSVAGRSAAPSVVSLPPSVAPTRYVVVPRERPSLQPQSSPSLQRHAGRPSSVLASSAGPGYHAARASGAQQVAPAGQSLNWLTEFMKRVWPSIAENIGSRVRSKVQAYEFEKGANVLSMLDEATRELQKVELVFPPTHCWLNQVLKIYWPVLSQTMDLMVREKIVPQVAQNVPSFLGALELDSCTLGATPPEIKEFKVLTDPISTGWMDIQCELEYSSEPDLQLSLGKTLTIGLKKLLVSMTMFISFYGAMPRPPFFAGMSIYLSKAPHVDTVWTHLGEFLSQEFMNAVISKALKSAMVRYVLPHRKIKLLNEDECAMEIIQPQPRGCLRITVLEAQNLVGTDFGLSTLWTGELTTDPYVRINIGPLSWRSPTVQTDTNPEWDEDNSVLILIDAPERQMVELSIFDDGLRQQLKAKMQIADSMADEVARLGTPVAVTELFGCAATDLTSQRDTDMWLDLQSWWPGRFCNLDMAREAHAMEQETGDDEISPMSRMLQQPVNLIKEQVSKRQHAQDAEREEKCKQAKAKIRIRVEWKPLGVAPAAIDHGEAEKREAVEGQGAAAIGHATGRFTRPLVPSESSGSVSEESQSSGSEDTDDEEDVEWPSYVMSIGLRHIDKIRCSDNSALTTTYQVAIDVNRAVSSTGKACNKSDQTTKELLTRYVTKAAYATPATTALLGGQRDEKNDALAHKIEALLAQDLPIAVIASVLEISERSILRYCMSGTTQTDSLREVEFNESAIFLLPDMPEVRLNFELSAIKDKVPQLMGIVSANLQLNERGVNRSLVRQDMTLEGKFKHFESLGACRVTACIKIWPFVCRTPALSSRTQASIMQEQYSREAREKCGGSKFGRLRIVSARGLRAADVGSHSDPYCIVRARKTAKGTSILAQTRVIDNTPDPMWDHGPITVRWDAVKELRFEVWDKDYVGPGDFLGRATLSKEKCQMGFFSDLDLGDGRGTLCVEVRPAEYKTREDGSMYLHEYEVTWQPPPGVDIFRVWVNSATHLKAANWLGGSSDPYVVCSLGSNQGFTTGAITGTLNPTWNHGPEEFEWGGESKSLVFEVRDKDLVGSKFLGKVAFDKKECFEGLEGPQSLGAGRGKLNVTIQRVEGGRLCNEPKARLKITIQAAEQLRKSDFCGLSDPYCQCKCRGEVVFQTETVWNSLNPVWTTPAQVVEASSYKDLHFDVYDKDVGTEDDLLGSAVLTREFFESGMDGLLPLGVGSGRLHVKIERLRDGRSAALAGSAKAPSFGRTHSLVERKRGSDSWWQSLRERWTCSPTVTFGLLRDKLQDLRASKTSAPIETQAH